MTTTKRKTQVNQEEQTVLHLMHLRARGMTYEFIANELKVTRKTLYNLRMKYKQLIDEAETAYTHELIEQYAHSHAKRLQKALQHLDRINQAIDLQDLTKLKTKELFELREHLHQEIEQLTHAKEHPTDYQDKFGAPVTINSQAI